MYKELKPVLIKSISPKLVALSYEDTHVKDLGRQIIFVRKGGPADQVHFKSTEIVALDRIEPGTVGLTEFVFKSLGIDVDNPEPIHCSLEIRERPQTYNYIKAKMKKRDTVLTKQQIDAIVADVVSGELSSLEKSAFLLSQYYQDYNMDEIEHLCRAIATSGEVVDWSTTAYDKHSLGGVPGNKVTLLIVPIMAAAGLFIPKTSSRAITSPSGTADTMEALGCNVSFTSEEIKEITRKAGGCIVWGGALNLAPADDILIKEVEFPLGINPRSMMMASIMAKKYAQGIDFLVLDVPTGKGCKVTDLEEAQTLSRNFGELGRRLGIHVECGITFGSLPVGHAIGPALEAREALQALISPTTASTSLVEKSTILAGMGLEMSGKAVKGQGQAMAKEILYSGKAYQKMKQIIEAQGGNPEMKPEDVPIGKYTCEYRAPADGWPADIDNTAVTLIAQTAGAPTDKGAGVHFIVKKEAVKAGDVIFRVHSSSPEKIANVEAMLPKTKAIVIEGMLLGRV